MMFGMGQTGFVFGVWVLIKLMDHFSTFIFVCLILLILFGTAILILILPKVAMLSSESEELIRIKLDVHYCSDCRVKRRFYFFAKWRAQNSIIIDCAGFFRVEKSITRDFVNVLVNNLVDAVMLIDP